MPTASDILYYLLRPEQLRAIIQWKVWHNPVHERDEDSEPITLRKCFDYLDKTSRSFSAVIKELNPELLVPICLFYLILRGLDTIEDDMTIDLKEKNPILRDFHNILDKDGWTYDGNASREKDRDLLVEFHYVITEFKKIKPQYQKIIKDITRRMGDGMADYQANEDQQVNGLSSIKDYEHYCHYVAGILGEGLTRLFVDGNLANPGLLQRPELHESMGQFLQQVNVIRDIREDLDDNRRFWPKEIWSKHVSTFEDLCQPAHLEQALECSSEMILNALTRAPDCLYYLAGIKDQSVFNFCAIPQSMAIATLELCFRNPELFRRNVKISKGHACQLMLESTQNLQTVCEAFRKCTRGIHKKNDPRDPNFLSISIACGQIEQFIESIFPSKTPQKDAVPGYEGLTPEEAAKKKAEADEAWWDMAYMGIAVLGTLCFISLFMILLAWLAGARFDLAFSQLWNMKLRPTSLGAPSVKNVPKSSAHGEL